MSLRTARSMGDVSQQPSPLLPHDLSSFTGTHLTESDVDDDDDSDDDFYFDFPQPPSISHALRRMRSSPWYSQHLAAISRPERRHSVSPLIQHPDGWPRPGPPSEPQYSTDSAYSSTQNRSLETASEIFLARGMLSRPEEEAFETCELLRPPIQREPLIPRRQEPLPPPAPAPSIPLPRLPRIIRKVASMRSDSKRESSVEPPASSRRSVPKIRSLKFMSGSMGLGNTKEEGKRGWSLSRPTSFQRPKAPPGGGPSYSYTNGGTSDHLGYSSCSRMPLEYASPAVYSNPCLIGHMADLHSNSVTFSQDGRFDLSRGSSTLAPPFAQRATSSSPSAMRRYSNNSCANGATLSHSMGPEQSCSSISHDRPASGSQRPPHSFYNIRNEGKGRSASSSALLQGAKSFINITPERRKSGRSKSRSSNSGFGNESGSAGHQMGSAMKEKGEKMKRLLVRASSGVVDWGRQLRGRTVKPTTVNSTPRGLAPLTGMQG
ncbi:hypothetical protein P691DRAFT_233825 [Macrolepiota fuliginosa MF-IS2]|uniref:Uncharacterized protein n=1 Tax=Macrolepiota fuliginosa MF-IS2 TaxID=1400762 RepID=A0A9P6C8K8_9AGAR|nr:hypothetical protein P691DRAFT_233825 [Macrolepiota fuliginosa MF-IS2]